MTTPAPEGGPVEDEATEPATEEAVAPPRYEHSAVADLRTESRAVAEQHLRPAADQAAGRFFDGQPWEWLEWDVDVNLTSVDGLPTAWYARGTAAAKEGQA